MTNCRGGENREGNSEKLATLGTQDEVKRKKTPTQYRFHLDTTMHKQLKQDIGHHTNNWRKIRTEYRFHAEIVTGITTRNSESKDK